jgi:anthranilate synthase/aminodeoxychorismate synthase-like glutamine amidotransferase
VQYLGEMGHELKVFRNDAITLDSIESLAPKSIVISPGPGRPENSGIIIQLIREFAGKIPILGVCLGHQAIGAAFGGDVVPAPSIMHGKTSDIFHDGKTIFSGLPSPFRATRYHSLVVSPETFPDCLEISARTDDGVIMGLRHREIIVEGVQFHPESILTDVGMKLLSNFVNL